MNAQYPRRVIFVVPANDQESANADAAGLGGDARTFFAALSPTGQAPATHYWASGQLPERAYQAARQLWLTRYQTGHLEEWDMDAAPGRPDALLTELGLQRITLPD